ncbi:hypothetical protein ZOSMA_99G00790 [Zostera marina]|uniref:AB hydrolase-1 domain-containing protein n=1 Tax=Zostera marina TaxID=29655 RepID=A0A0K9NHQ7_ZOSMR|nr:hypothetical protein ZOSMA_99G00790 [Zostera marina]
MAILALSHLPTPFVVASHNGLQSRELRLPYRLQEGQSRIFHRLSSGLSMEAIVQKGDDSVGGASHHSPIVFVHGSFHAAWCWAEHWLPYFSHAGYDCYAVSLLGQGESDLPNGKFAGTLETHTCDIADFIQEQVKNPPILIGHSFGGLIIQSYIANMTLQSSLHRFSHSGRRHSPPMLAGAVLACSVPPSGNGGLVWRYLMSKPIAAIKVTLSLAAKAFANSLPLCKETFFSPTMGDLLVQRYQDLMKESSRVPLFNLRELNASLPVQSVPRNSTDILVLGAKDDFIVDLEGLNETAKFYGIDPVCVEGVAHDIMLDVEWEKGAQVILSWIKSSNFLFTSSDQ